MSCCLLYLLVIILFVFYDTNNFINIYRPESELQTVLGEFLQARGIGKSVAAFLCDYAMWSSQESDRLDVEILEKMKKVVSDW